MVQSDPMSTQAYKEEDLLQGRADEHPSLNTYPASVPLSRPWHVLNVVTIPLYRCSAL